MPNMKPLFDGVELFLAEKVGGLPEKKRVKFRQDHSAIFFVYGFLSFIPMFRRRLEYWKLLEKAEKEFYTRMQKNIEKGYSERDYLCSEYTEFDSEGRRRVVKDSAPSVTLQGVECSVCGSRKRPTKPMTWDMEVTLCKKCQWLSLSEYKDLLTQISDKKGSVYVKR